MSRGATRFSALIALIGLLASSGPVWAGSPPPLRFDPFRARPEVVARARTPGRNLAERTFEPLLLSTVTGSGRALANLGGEILAIGEETHGYRLIAVGTFEAVFVKDGKRIRLEVVGRQEAAR